jgi:hypothetical protein
VERTPIGVRSTLATGRAILAGVGQGCPAASRG